MSIGRLFVILIDRIRLYQETDYLLILKVSATLLANLLGCDTSPPISLHVEAGLLAQKKEKTPVRTAHVESGNHVITSEESIRRICYTSLLVKARIQKLQRELADSFLLSPPEGAFPSQRERTMTVQTKVRLSQFTHAPFCVLPWS